jgi:hypothetical protein
MVKINIKIKRDKHLWKEGLHLGFKNRTNCCHILKCGFQGLPTDSVVILPIRENYMDLSLGSNWF